MITINTITIGRIGRHKTVKFAANELAKYLKLMDKDATIDMRIYDDYDENLTDVLWVGMSDKFDAKLPAVEDKTQDDAILIDVQNYCGIITGANNRAVLFAAYRFLRELGVDWIRPGFGEEIIPEKALDTCNVKVSEVPYYRGRTICIEGAISYAHVHNIIDWMPKVGLNTYNLQFFIPFTFFNRWYRHEHNPYIKGKQITEEDVIHIQEQIFDDILDRSLGCAAPGHGWTSDPFGVKGTGWFKYEGELPEKYKNVLAMKNGKRELNGGVPLNTNLCYTDPYVIETMTDAAIQYLKDNPAVTFLGFTLADGSNSHCECENCKDKTASDLYVGLLNRLDEKLTQNGMDTKVGISIYTDTLWAPVTEKIKNPDRFSLCVCPITRSYADSYLDLDFTNLEDAPPYVRNNITLPKSVSQSMKFLKDWQKATGCTQSGIFEYHLWTRPNYDIGRDGLAYLVHRDIRALDNFGITSYTSCQSSRMSFPNNLLMETLAQTLWNKDVDYEEMKEKYMKNCYGKEYKKAQQYLEKLSLLICPGPDMGSEALSKLPAKERYEMSEKAIELAVSFRAEVEKILAEDNFEYEAQKKSWQYLVYNTGIAERIAKIYLNRFTKRTREETEPLLEDLRRYFREIEPIVHDDLDVWRTTPGKEYVYYFGDETSNF